MLLKQNKNTINNFTEAQSNFKHLIRETLKKLKQNKAGHLLQTIN